MLTLQEVSLGLQASFGRFALFLLMCFLATALLARGQETQLPVNPKDTGGRPASTPRSPDGSAPDTLTFKVNVNLVPVRVIVRDAHGQAVGNLHKEDFQVFDRGKPQVISQFSVEPAGGQGLEGHQQSNGVAGPDRFVAYVFDDVHLKFGDLAHARDDFERHVASLRPSDRAAIATISGKAVLDFTDDRAKLRKVSEFVRPNPTGGAYGCPKLTYFAADQIENKRNGIFSRQVYQDAVRCGIPAKSIAQTISSLARQQLAIGEQETRNTLAALKYLVQSISSLPGQKVIILVSPGFIFPELEYEYSELVDQALRAQVVISALDARGVYVILPDESEEEKSADSQILAALAEGTGGMFFHGNNDFNEGFRRLAAPPEYSYLVGFAAQGLKADGKFHKLKVTGPQNLTIQARPGYYAPKRGKEQPQAAK